ncbi:hypothetical protein [Noviherbaspirillum sp.]|uniref:hypothetical protein n=1 Tax=Noviherbaspirillum sp. TaxID=1926288 RepID=UPI002FE27616
MKRPARLLIAALFAWLQGCAILHSGTITPGETEAQVIAKLGQPTNRYKDEKGGLLEYARGPWGQQTYMARIGPDGRVTSFEQVLTLQKFATITPGQANKKDVLHTIGAPSDTSYLSLSDLEVWSYPYKESDVWNSLMHVHFDRNGVVQKMMNGPDPRFDPDMRFPFGLSRR